MDLTLALPSSLFQRTHTHISAQFWGVSVLSCGTQASWLRDVSSPTRTGPAFPALRSRFLAPAPPGGAPVCALAGCAGSVLCEALPLQGRRGVFLTYANIIQLEMGSLWSVVS